MKILFTHLCLLVCFVGLAVPARAQTDEDKDARKVISRVVPEYPELARTIRLSGSGKLEVLVLSNGRVKSVHVKGGNAVLVQSAENAVRGWQWQRAIAILPNWSRLGSAPSSPAKPANIQESRRVRHPIL
jgi:hypothetical protein